MKRVANLTVGMLGSFSDASTEARHLLQQCDAVSALEGRE